MCFGIVEIRESFVIDAYRVLINLHPCWHIYIPSSVALGSPGLLNSYSMIALALHTMGLILSYYTLWA